MSEKAKLSVVEEEKAEKKSSREQVVKNESNEFVFAVVGYVGSGNSQIASSLKKLLEEKGFEVSIIKARIFIKEYAASIGNELPCETKTTADVVAYQDAGNEMRENSSDDAIIAKNSILKIRENRANSIGVESSGTEPIIPDGKKRAYIIDSIRHPAEVNLLRNVYQNAFILIGVVCREDVRSNRLMAHYSASKKDSLLLMEKDAKSGNNFGQRTIDAFHLSDFFLDNSIDRFRNVGGEEQENDEWLINEKLSRLIKIITHSEVVRPEMSETAMHHAFGAKLRSSCLSRQVGAALVDNSGNVLATGTNEVPKSGGGVIGENFVELESKDDHRCFFRKQFCSNTRRHNEIINNIVEDLGSIIKLNSGKKIEITKMLKDGEIGDLIEFSRAIHAEMDAVLSAARSGADIKGTRLFCTTFPCHYCARHLVTAGIDEVQYIEPYPKSEATDLHSDAIVTIWDKNWIPPSEGGEKVLFRPFSGVAPRLYRLAFIKDRDLKNKETGDMDISDTQWGTPWHLGKKSYVELESILLESENE